MDIRLIYNAESMSFDIGIENGDLAIDEGLETPTIVSLFTHRRANADDQLPDSSGDLRGWWADQFLENPGDKIGSRDWLLSREKELPSVLVRAKDYGEEALRWMVDDQIARAVEVTAEVVQPGVLGRTIQILRADGASLKYRFDNFWRPA